MGYSFIKSSYIIGPGPFPTNKCRNMFDRARNLANEFGRTICRLEECYLMPSERWINIIV